MGKTPRFYYMPGSRIYYISINWRCREEEGVRAASDFLHVPRAVFRGGGGAGVGGGEYHPPVPGRQRLSRILPHHDDPERQEKQNQVSTKISPEFSLC